VLRRAIHHSRNIFVSNPLPTAGSEINLVKALVKATIVEAIKFLLLSKETSHKRPRSISKHILTSALFDYLNKRQMEVQNPYPHRNKSLTDQSPIYIIHPII
jgi:hypothetical protein